MQHDQRVEPRFFVVTPVAAEIAGVNADLVDLSTRGARLQVTQQLKSGTSVPLTLRAGGVSMATPATVVWCDIAALAFSDEESDRYLCGVTFTESLSMIRHLIDDLVAAKAAMPITESRLSDRYRVIAPLTASFGEYGSLRVLDLSIRGARVLTPQMLPAGMSARLRFTIDQTDTHVWLPATVVWSRPAERKGRFEAGLRIDDAEAWLQSVIDELSLRNGVAIETDSLRRKFNPFAAKPVAGLVALR
ncbi:MAG TPA: PilZ domain-containing protein [Thermoanaerobaculia bacterium]|nr:PilZ domain-containing protein [Thermoanaerobaculia bacterium]